MLALTRIPEGVSAAIRHVALPRSTYEHTERGREGVGMWLGGNQGVRERRGKGSQESRDGALRTLEFD